MARPEYRQASARLVGAVTEQTWRRWEAGAWPVPDDVARRMTEIVDWRIAAMEATGAQMRAAPDDVRLAIIWYRALEDWMTLPGREPALWRPQQSVCGDLFVQFPRLVPVPFDGPAYFSWLGSRAHSEAMRSQWAAS